jgi:hypothetical protein
LPTAAERPQGSQATKTLKCHGLEIEALIIGGHGAILLRDTAYRDMQPGRKIADEQKKRSEFNKKQ